MYNLEFVNKIINEDCLTGLKRLPDNSIDCSISSPPYWALRDYGCDGQIGLEDDFNDYIEKLTAIYAEIYRTLKPTGCCFINLGDTYTGAGIHAAHHKNPGKSNSGVRDGLNGKSKPSLKVNGFPSKSLLMIPERFALAMIDTGWILRNQIIWHKPNQMPQSASDRFTVDFEKIFFFVKQPTGYYFKQQLEIATGYDGRKELNYNGGKKDVSMTKHTRWKYYRNLDYKGQTPNSIHLKRLTGTGNENYFERNMRTVWSINTYPFSESHFATFPEKLVKRMITAGCPENGLVLDPFMGAGTTAVVAKKLNRNYTGFEINKDYIRISEKRLNKEIGLFA